MKTARLAVSFAVSMSLAGCVQTTPEPPDVRSTSQPVTVADGQPENTTAKGSAAPVTKSPQVIQALETQPILRTTWQRTQIRAWCMGEAGFVAEINEYKPNSIRFDVGHEGETPELEQAFGDCNDKYELTLRREMTREDARKEYNHRLTTMTCMRDQGLVITDPPSKNSFVDDYLKELRTGEDLHVWSPWEQYMQGELGGSAGFIELQKTCPRHRPNA